MCCQSIKLTDSPLSPARWPPVRLSMGTKWMVGREKRIRNSISTTEFRFWSKGNNYLRVSCVSYRMQYQNWFAICVSCFVCAEYKQWPPTTEWKQSSKSMGECADWICASSGIEMQMVIMCDYFDRRCRWRLLFASISRARCSVIENKRASFVGNAYVADNTQHTAEVCIHKLFSLQSHDIA